jgi:hypothetical protein
VTWRRHALWLLCLLLSGCTLIPTPPSLPTPMRPPELESTADALGAALEGNYPLDALTIRYETGNPAFGGRTTLTAHGGGKVEVTYTLGDRAQAWQASLSEDEFLALCRLLVDHEVWAIQGRREAGVPDEAYPTVTVEAEGFEPLVVGMWDGEAREHPDFRPILDVLAGMAREISGGAAQ